MPYERINIQLAIKEPLPAILLQKPTQAQLTALGQMTWLEIIQEMIRRFKKYSEKINAGRDNEEDTTQAKRHRCQHDVGLSCSAEEDI